MLKSKKRIKYIGYIITLIFLVIWIVRVLYVNKKYSADTVYLNMNTQIDFGDYIIIPEESKLLSVNEFESYFGLNMEDFSELGINETDKIICLRLHIRNTSGHTLEWRDVLSECGEGFETITWGSSYEMMLGRIINILYEDSFGANCEIDYWLVTPVSKISFKKVTWENLSVDDFMFTFSLYPNSVKIRLN